MPKAVDREARLAEIAGAVRRVLERDGVDQVTMRNVAAELGSTTGLLTHWVPDRAGLLLVALQATADDQSARAIAAFARHPGDVLAAIEAFLPLDDARRADAKVWFGFWALALTDPALHDEQRERYRSFRATIVDHLVAHGRRRVVAVTAADRIMTAVDGIVVSATFDPDHWTPARQRAVARAAVSAALTPGPP